MAGDSSMLEDNYIIIPPSLTSELCSPLTVIALYFQGSFQKDISTAGKRNADSSVISSIVLRKRSSKRAKKLHFSPLSRKNAHVLMFQYRSFQVQQ